MNRLLVAVVIAAAFAWVGVAAQAPPECHSHCVATIVTDGAGLGLKGAELPFHTHLKWLTLVVMNNTRQPLKVQLTNFHLHGQNAPKCPGRITPRVRPSSAAAASTSCESGNPVIAAGDSVAFAVFADQAAVNDHYKFDIIATPAAGGKKTTFDPELIVDPNP